MSERTRMEQALDAMKQLQRDRSDPEKNASDAEEIIKAILRNLGCEKLVQAWEKVERY